MKKHKESICACATCIDMCKDRPCWPNPKEAQSIINAGLGDRLMLDYWVSYPDNILILSPAINGYESENAPDHPTGRCTFLNDNNLCELHDKGLKPIEGRIAKCNNVNGILHKEVAMTWDNDKAIEIVNEWKKQKELL